MIVLREKRGKKDEKTGISRRFGIGADVFCLCVHTGGGVFDSCGESGGLKSGGGQRHGGGF